MTETEKPKKGDFKLSTEEMAQAGLHFGHKTSRIHPKIKPYLYGARNTVHIFDLEKTKEKMEEALEFVKELASTGKIILLVGTKVQIKGKLKEIAKECNLPYVSERWIGGTFTNFETIKKRIDHLKDLEQKQKQGDFEKYTKKEQLKKAKEMESLEMKFGGLRDLVKAPDAVFVLDLKKDDLAIKEARMKEVKIIAVADTNVNPEMADYPIPANDDALTSLVYILEKFKEVFLKNRKKEVPAEPEKKE